MATFYTSDTHFGHAAIIDYCDRPWPDVEAMNEGLIERWNSVVKPGDTVYHLGDVAMGNRAANLRNILRLNGAKRLVWGNHDTPWNAHPTVIERAMTLYRSVGFVMLGTQYRHVIGGRDVLLSHLPTAGDHTEQDRYTAERPVTDLPVICGHVHNAWLTNGQNINVGVDVWDYMPVHEDWLIEIMEAAA